MTTQIIVKANAIGLTFNAQCDYSFAWPSSFDDPGAPSEVTITGLLVEVDGKWTDCMYLMQSDVGDQIYDAVEALADGVAIEDRDESRADYAEANRIDAVYLATI